MGVSLVELHGSIPRQQDFQILKQSEDQKPVVDQNNLLQQTDKTSMQAASQVKKKDDTSKNQDRNENDRESRYFGDGGRNRKKTKDGIVVNKDAADTQVRKSFDFRI